MKAERLSPLDATFLDVETSGPSVAVGGAMRVAGKPPTLAELQKYFSDRLDQMHRFRQKVVESRTKVRHYKWVDTKPNLDYHVRQVKLKRGESLDGVVSDVMETPMDRKQPLWDCTLVTGYSLTEWAVITRLHHSIADGQGAVILLGQLIDMSPGPNAPTLGDAISAMTQPQEETAEPYDRSGFDAMAAKMISAIDAGFENVGQFISTYPDTVRTVLSFIPQKPTDLTGPVSAKRKWVGGSYSLLDIKQARKAFKGVTINDMVLAAVGYGFTQLLQSRGEDPNYRTLRAVMPVSLRKDLSSNNQVSILPAPIPLGEMPPGRRMRMIQQSTKHAKRSMLPKIGDKVMKATEKLTPAPLQEFVVSRSGITSQYFSDTLVTNVPGPQIPLYFMGQEIVGSIPIIPIEGSLRIIVGITSFGSDLNIGITGDGEYATDVDVLLAAILAGFDEICDVAAAKRAKRAARAG